VYISNLKPTLNLSSAGLSKSLWLVKIPKFVAEEWSRKQDGDKLGSLSSSAVKDPATNQVIKKLKVTLDTPSGDEYNSELLFIVYRSLLLLLTYCAVDDVALQFTLEEIGHVSKSNDIVAFVHNDQSNQYSLVGKCTKSLALKPKDSHQYHQLRQKRLLAESVRPESQELDISKINSHPLPPSTYIVNLASAASSSSTPTGTTIQICIDCV